MAEWVSHLTWFLSGLSLGISLTTLLFTHRGRRHDR